MTSKEKMARNKWYKLSLVLDGGFSGKVVDIAALLGYTNEGLRSFLRCKGKQLAEKYGRLPYNEDIYSKSKRLRQYMEVE